MIRTLKILAVMLFSLLITGCKKDEPTQSPANTQGPRDASFETGSPYWHTSGGCSGRFAMIQPGFYSGTSFMPTNGLHYASFSSISDCESSSYNGSIYEYNVDFSNSKTMMFDYEVIASGSATCTGGAASLTATISFTGNGTKTLWTKTFTLSGPVDIQMKDETVPLPSGLPTYDSSVGSSAQNQITITVTGYGGCVAGASLNMCPCVELTFNIDNIRVQ